MNQCVPCCDIGVLSNSSIPPFVPSFDDEVAELTWQNGRVAIHSLAQPRVATKPTPLATGTLESIVNQQKGYYFNEAVPWFDDAAIDALVPAGDIDSQQQTTHVLQSVPEISTSAVGYSTGVGSCSYSGGGATLDLLIDGRTSATCAGLNSVSFGSLEKNKDYTKATAEDQNSSGCYSAPQRKRRRAAANHSQSERKRRDKINQKMKTLRSLVPNSCKTDKASILDDVIEYLKQLQAQVRLMMFRTNTSPMIMTLPIHHHMPPMGMGVMDMNTFGRPIGGMLPFIPLPSCRCLH